MNSISESRLEHDRLLALHFYATRFFQSQLAGSWVPDYLTGRGFGRNVQDLWQVGYAPAGRDALTRRLRSAGFPDSLIVAGGLARQSPRGGLADTFRDRAILPIRAPDGNVIAFIGRAPEHAGPDVPKYLNSPATLIYRKGDALFGRLRAQSALEARAMPVIAEGPFDVMAIAVAGRHRYAPAAPCGTALTAHQVEVLNQACDLGETGVLVAFDADAAGQRAAIRAYRLLRPVTDRIAAVTFAAGTDPAQILRDHGAAGLAATLDRRRRPLADLVVDAATGNWTPRLPFAEGQIGALRAIAPVIAAMPPRDVARQVARLAQRLGLDHAMVTEAVTDALTQLISGRNQARTSSLDFPASARHNAAEGTMPVADPASRRAAPGTHQADLRTGRIPR